MIITKERLLKERESIIIYRDKSLRDVEQATGALQLVEFLIQEFDKDEDIPSTIDQSESEV